MKWFAVFSFIGMLILMEFCFYRSMQILLKSPNWLWYVLVTGTVISFGAFVVFVSFFRKKGVVDYTLPFWMMGVVILCETPKMYTLIFYPVYLLVAYFSTVLPTLLLIGLILSSLQFIAVLHGVFRGRFNFKVRKVELTFEHLPSDLNETNLVQISDLHLGSFLRKYKRLDKAVELINEIKADYVVFTGDLVNNYAEEAEGWETVLNKIKAKKGIYSILGNHDYGDYVPWETQEAHDLNVQKLIEMHQKIGFEVLLNKSIPLSENENKAYLIGIENWGAPPFKQYGNLNKAMEGVSHDSFKLLLSHDPSHFDYEVTTKTNIDLTLSGHTHGMQFGFDRWGIKLSPIKLKYPRWAGLYQLKNQYLYVNRGLGYIGFPGRVGIYPEITHVILRKNDYK